MSIVDAVEKAKRLKKERDAVVKATGRRAIEPNLEETHPHRQEETHAHRQSVSLAPGRVSTTPPVESVVFPQRPYSVEACSNHRIIVPDAPSELLKAATSPYRILRTRILQRCRANSWSVLGLTSAGPSEGKSVTALNLAISVAREGNSEVFLLDLDMRNPSIWRYLGARPDRQLKDFFRGTASAQDVLYSPGITNLVVAGSIEPDSDASELLASAQLEELLTYLKRIANNPLIIVDLPPVVNTDDALVAAPRMDAIAVVASEGVTRRDSLDTALGLLADFTLAGVILNQSMESLGSDYYGAY